MGDRTDPLAGRDRRLWHRRRVRRRPGRLPARLGLSAPPARLQGEITHVGAWEDEAPWYADDLAVARLKVLERQGRYQEYLHLARAEGQLGLLRHDVGSPGANSGGGRRGIAGPDQPAQFLALAQVLRERQELAAALRVAEHGLTVEGDKGELATWLCDLADGMGETELALEAATVAFRDMPSLAAYQRVQELAGERWPEMREDCSPTCARLPATPLPSAGGCLFPRGPAGRCHRRCRKGRGLDLIEQVMDAVLEYRPDWVIEAARRQAERIVEPGSPSIITMR